MREISKDKAENIIELYKKGCSVEDIKRQVGVCWHTVNRCLTLNGLRNIKSTVGSRPYKYTEFFPTDDKILGYICGWIATDGCLEFNSNVVRLDIHKDDRKILDWLSQTLVGENIIKVYKQMGCFKAALPKLYAFCLSIGITTSKTLTLNVDLAERSSEFKLYFLRGAVDGDGDVQVGNGLGSCHINITSASLGFLETLQLEFGGRIRFKGNKTKGAYILNFGSKKSKAIGQILPLDDFTLERKTLKIKELLTKEFNNPGHMVNKITAIVATLPDGTRVPFIDYVKFFGIVDYKTAWHRLNTGWSQIDAATTPVKALNYAKKLSPEQAIAIFMDTSGDTHKEMSNKYGVGTSSISMIRSGKHWGETTEGLNRFNIGILDVKSLD